MAFQEEPDPDYPVLTRQQVHEMYQLSLRTAAERGLEASIDGGWLVLQGGDRLSFFNLARKLAALDSAAAWADCVSANLNVLLASKSRGSTLAGGPTDDIVSRAYPQLYRVGTLIQDAVDDVYHRELLPGVLELLVEDFPESFGPFTADVIADCGLQNLFDSAAANLATVNPELSDSFEGINLFTGSSSYIAVMVRDVRWIARRWLAGADVESWGALVAVPTRRHLLVHPPTSAEGALAAMVRMDWVASQLYASEPDPISQSAYWWHGDEYYRVVPPGGAREPDIPQRLMDVLTAMPEA